MKIKNIWLFNFGDDILISILITTVESNLRTSQSWNTIGIMDWAYTKTSTARPHFSPTMLILLKCPVVGKKHYVRNRNKPTIITELQINLQKHTNIYCCSFNKILIFKRTVLKRKTIFKKKKVWLNDKFWPHDKFWLFLT